jgi:hypothetical protein
MNDQTTPPSQPTPEPPPPRDWVSTELVRETPRPPSRPTAQTASAQEETAKLRTEVARLNSELGDAKAAVERVEDLQEVWERTDPQGLMSRRRAAAILGEVIRP